MIEIIRKQPKVQNLELTKIVFLNSVTTYLLNKNETTFNAILKPFGSIINTYHISISINDIKPIRKRISKQDILIHLAKVILNESGYNINMLALLKYLVTYNKS